jgi:hypothetical protein
MESYLCYNVIKYFSHEEKVKIYYLLGSNYFRNECHPDMDTIICEHYQDLYVAVIKCCFGIYRAPLIPIITLSELIVP